MIICVSAQTDDPNGPFEPRFGRAPWFHLVEEATGKVTPLQNPFTMESGGIGPRVVQFLTLNEVSVVVTGQIGQHAATALSAAGIAVYFDEVGGSVSEVITRYRKSDPGPATRETM